MSGSTVKYNTDGKVAEIILSRPEKLNAFSTQLREDLSFYLDKVETSPDIRIVVLRGEGRGFSAGADLTEPTMVPISEQLELEYKPIFKKIVDGKKLYLAAVHGSAAGIGAALALSCDFLVMSERARVSLIFSNINLVPDGGLTWSLMSAVGYRKALEIIVEGKHISAQECLRWGIANKIFEEDLFVLDTNKWATSLALRAPLASVEAKKLLREHGKLAYWQAFDDEGQAQNMLSQTEDFRNAVEAFFLKKNPNFKGQ